MIWLPGREFDATYPAPTGEGAVLLARAGAASAAPAASTAPAVSAANLAVLRLLLLLLVSMFRSFGAVNGPGALRLGTPMRTGIGKVPYERAVSDAGSSLTRRPR